MLLVFVAVILIAIVVVFVVSPRSAPGVACKAVTVALLTSAVLLQEGILCLVMAAPLFYLVAIVFIVFDALAVFLFPWALVLRSVGMTAFWVMAAFVGIILLGWVYAYREGVLEWK